MMRTVDIGMGRTRRLMQQRLQHLTRSRLLVAALALGGSAMTAQAQGSLSGLGFGYPVGGTSTRASATAGAFGEFDMLSPLNPASIAGVGRVMITAQTEPEYRRLRSGTVDQKNTAQRVPLLMVIFPAGNAVSLSLSATTFLDHSYSTVVRSSQTISGATIETTDRTDVRGSIADLRAAAGWRINDHISIGAGAHLFQGDNLVAIARTFDDTTRFGNASDSSRAVFFGTALSLGSEWRIRKGLAATLSYRIGGAMDARVRDTVKTTATVPNRLGVSVRYDGIPGATFAVGVDQQDWTRMRGLGSASIQPRDATSWHAGVEVAGPKIRDESIFLRAGIARNALPFGVSSRVVDESRLSAGLGIPVARDQASIDISVQRATRTLVGASARESAWMLGIGLQIRP